jgi:hypothetical protein
MTLLSMIRLYLLVISLSLFYLPQAFSKDSPLEFCNYLYANQNYTELKNYCNTLIESPDTLFDSNVKDTLKLFLVKAKLKIDINDTSIQKVETKSILAKLEYLKIYQFLYTKRIESLDTFLVHHAFLREDSGTMHLIDCFKMLKIKEYARCETTNLTCEIELHTFRDKIVQKKIIEIVDFVKSIKKKSALKSAVISCFIPGYGKKYVGLPGEAVGTLLTNGVLGAVFAEAIWRKGFKSPYTIGAGLLFSTFYFSNIVGSYYAAKRFNLQQQRIVDEKIDTSLDFWANTYFE